ncbi:hypothetical protein EPR50_G00236640 [Perca flavescens]|uniref:Prostaglandin E2 receptor EP2 subtype n=1 Tax=Perca flavescens TaxID=8167 RepID=A0A484C3E4_PERFV|nr:prostaglandin E2 receptor EP2 subtype [Perca flavescens]XP_028427468.1 prostaglandin E2 receptor EP2 subtype [Perca flavescens]TDG96134.1 hypothetical protein EPR50_G00236640 [Perca flavescens]
MKLDNNTCYNDIHIKPSESPSPLISAVMFAAGIFGNVAALVILEIQRRRDTRTGETRRRSLFHVLIKSLVVTDLAGTCLTSPLVLLSYSRNTTLVGLSPNSQSVCSYFGVSIIFFSLATLLLLFSMALERCFAIGYPYLYSRYVTNKCAYITIPVAFVLCMLFCLLPFAGFGKYVQYCPGTWCFIDMNPQNLEDQVYANLYATLMLVLVLAIVVCNGFVVYQLFRMYQRRRRNGGSRMATKRSNSERRAMSMAEEVEHLILLVFMTIIFIICTMPLVIRVYINSIRDSNSISDSNSIRDPEESRNLDLIALRFISINSIIDPWVFILLSPSVLHFCWASVCRDSLETSRGSIFKLSIAKRNSPANHELPRPPLEHFHSVETL